MESFDQVKIRQYAEGLLNGNFQMVGMSREFALAVIEEVNKLVETRRRAEYVTTIQTRSPQETVKVLELDGATGLGIARDHGQHGEYIEVYLDKRQKKELIRALTKGDDPLADLRAKLKETEKENREAKQRLKDLSEWVQSFYETYEQLRKLKP